VPYAPGAYLDKMLANLTHDRVQAAALATRVWEHVQFVSQAMDAVRG
jgi:hypothetical protein